MFVFCWSTGDHPLFRLHGTPSCHGVGHLVNSLERMMMTTFLPLDTYST